MNSRVTVLGVHLPSTSSLHAIRIWMFSMAASVDILSSETSSAELPPFGGLLETRMNSGQNRNNRFFQMTGTRATPLLAPAVVPTSSVGRTSTGTFAHGLHLRYSSQVRW